MPRVRHQEGFVRKTGKRPKKWEGVFYVYELRDGVERRLQRTKILGAATLQKYEAEKLLRDHIEQQTGQRALVPHKPTFAATWERYANLKSAKWSSATARSTKSVFKRCVLPSIGDLQLKDLSFDPLQALLNGLASKGYRKSALNKVRTYLHAVFEYAIDEEILDKNPARKLEVPRTRKSCERMYTLDEVGKLLAATTGREHLILRLFIVCGLRPGELFALRHDDVEPCRLRIDEATHETEKGVDRIGETKTEASNSYVAISPAIWQELDLWMSHGTRSSPDGRSPFLFPSKIGTPFRHANYLKRVLKPLAARQDVGIQDLTYQAMRRTCATHFKGKVKDAQEHLRHASPVTTLRHYQKAIPESVQRAVDALDLELATKADAAKIAAEAAKAAALVGPATINSSVN